MMTSPPIIRKQGQEYSFEKKEKKRKYFSTNPSIRILVEKFFCRYNFMALPLATSEDHTMSTSTIMTTDLKAGLILKDGLFSKVGPYQDLETTSKL